MTQPIKRTDIYEGGDPFKELHDSLLKLQNELKQVNVELKNTKFDKSSDGVRKYNTEVKASQTIQQQIIATQNKLNEARSAEAKQLEVLKQQLKTATNERRKEAKEVGSIDNSLEKLRSTLNRNVQARERLNLSIKSHRVEFKRLTKDIQIQEAQLRKYDAQIGRSQRNVGNYASAFRSLGAAMGINLGIYGIFSVIRNALGVLTSFEKQMSRVKAISGATAEEFALLKKNAESLGGSTMFTATEIGKLQEELAKLGFSTTEILNTTEAASSLAIIAGGDLARAAEVAGATIRGFGFDAKESGRVVDVMAESFTSSALDMERFAEAMKYVAPVAKAAGVSLEETTAMLSKMADAGIHGSMAGSALRRILSELNKTGKTTGQAIGDLAKEGLSLADAEKEVGDRAKTALLVLADTVDETNKLTVAYENATGAAKKMADEIADNLQGDITLLSSAWDGFIIGLNSGDGVISKTFRNLVQAITSAVNWMNKLNASQTDLDNNKVTASIKKRSDEIIKNTRAVYAAMSEEEKKYTTIEDLQKKELEAQNALVVKKSNDFLFHYKKLQEEEKKLQDFLKKGGSERTALGQKEINELKEKVREKRIQIQIERGVLDMLKKQDDAIEEVTTANENLNNEAAKGNDIRKETTLQMQQVVNDGILVKIADDIDTFRQAQQQLNDPVEIAKMEKLIEAYSKLGEKIKSGNFAPDLSGIVAPTKDVEQPTPVKQGESDLVFPSLFITEEDIQVVGDSLTEIDNVLTDIVSTGLERRRKLIEQEISQTDDKISELTSLLQEERSKQEQGLANNTTKIEAELAKQNEIKQQSLDKEAEIAEKQAALTKTSLLLNQAATISNLVVSASQVTKGFTTIPIFGVPLAIAAIGSLFAFFKTATTQAKDFAKFEDGGTFVEGGNRHSEGGNKYGNGIETEVGERVSIFSRKSTSKYDDLIVDFTNAVNKDDMSLFDLNFRNKFNAPIIVGHDYGQLLSVNEMMLMEQKQTNDYLRRTKVVSGNKEVDLFGNSITRI